MRDAESESPKSVPRTQIPGDGNSSQIALPCSDNIEVPLARAAKRDLGQATLSTISEVSVAAQETLSRGKAPSREPGWLAVAGFLLVVYTLSCWLAIAALKSAPWVRVFLAPLAPVVLATLAFALSRRWKFRARDLKSDEQGTRNAVGSLGHEAANGVNAIRANLIAFRLGNPQVQTPEHLDELEQACVRLDAAVQKSQRSAGPQPQS